MTSSSSSLLLSMWLSQSRNHCTNNYGCTTLAAGPTSTTSEERCLWGTYRSYPYVGLRCRTPTSPLFGLLWYKPSLLQKQQQQSHYSGTLRHEYNYDDQLTRLGYTQHDGKQYAQQIIHDPMYDVSLTVQWIDITHDVYKKKKKKNEGTDLKEIDHVDGIKSTNVRKKNHWVLRIHGERYHHDTTTSDKDDISLLWYMATPDNTTAQIQQVSSTSSSSYITGIHDGLGRYRLWMESPTEPHGTNSYATYATNVGNHNRTVTFNATYFYAIQVPQDNYFNPKSYLQQELLQNPPLQTTTANTTATTVLLPSHLFDPNALYRAVTATIGNQVVQQVFYQLPFTIDLHFAYMDDNDDDDVEHNSDDTNHSTTTTWDYVTNALEQAKRSYELRFNNTFLHHSGNNKPSLDNAHQQSKMDEIADISPSSSTSNNAAATTVIRSAQNSRPLVATNNSNRNDEDDECCRHHPQTRQQQWTDVELRTAQYALSNMLGSITYMYGKVQIMHVDPITNETRIITEDRDRELVAVVPDKPSHGQGYLWDEGFQQHLVSLWDFNTSLTILQSWWDQMYQDPTRTTSGTDTVHGDNNETIGWLPRQQILGYEIQWSAKPTSWPQIPGTANPPTHHWILNTLLDRQEQRQRLRRRNQQDATNDGNDGNVVYDDEERRLRQFLHNIWNQFELNFDWYRRTQTSSIDPKVLFRWSGRTPGYCLASGLDDYPRAPILTDQEGHLDLQVWMIVSSKTLSRVANYLFGPSSSKVEYYDKLSKQYQEALLKYFWNPERQLFDDFYIDDQTKPKQFANHFGYINLWPILFEHVLDINSTYFVATVQQGVVNRTNGLWSPYGFRSLSVYDDYYAQGDNYWTGPIWLNVHYMLLSSLYKHKAHIATTADDQNDSLKSLRREDMEDAYQELRTRIIQTVVTNYENTGFIWEVYDATTGKGFNNHPFTGWSALIVNIMSENY